MSIQMNESRGNNDSGPKLLDNREQGRIDSAKRQFVQEEWEEDGES